MISGIYEGVIISTKIVFAGQRPGDDIQWLSPRNRPGSMAVAFPKSFAKAIYGAPKLAPVALPELISFLVFPQTGKYPPVRQESRTGRL